MATINPAFKDEPSNILSKPALGRFAVTATFFDSFLKVLKRAGVDFTTQFERYIPI